jgi:class 3 adenylate cyclase
MCASGLPTRNPSHSVDLLMAAFEMLESVESLCPPGSDRPWSIRIGIHTGPVIAGVVGIRKFAFDIWGDTVNQSSRMESNSEAGQINISHSTYTRVKDFFSCHKRGKVLTKEKRKVEMYFVEGILPKLLDDRGASPPPAFLRRYRIYFNQDPPDFPEFLLHSKKGARHAS